MSLFRVKGQPLKFDVVGLDDTSFSKIATIISENGGRVEHNDKQPIKFTRKEKFIMYAYPSYKLYDIKFIQDCIKNRTILDPCPYRIGMPMLYDNCLMYHFLNGLDNCCARQSPMPIGNTENATNVDSDDDTRDEQHTFEEDSDQSDSRVNGSRPINGSSSESTKNGEPWNHDNESETSSFSITEDNSSEAPRAHITSSESRKGYGFRYSDKGRGQKISEAERQAIVKFLVDNRLIGETQRGLIVWKEMIENGICANRNPNSLYRHFRKYILPNIESYNLTERQLQRFKKLFNPTK